MYVVYGRRGSGSMAPELVLADLYLWMLSSWWEPNPEALYRRCPKLAALAKAIEARSAVTMVVAANAG